MMATTTPSSDQPLPHGVQRFSFRWLAWVLLLTCGAAFGVYCYLHQLERGDVVTGMRTPGSGGAGWGLYIAFDIFFIGVSFASITVASLIRLFGLRALKPLARMAELLTIVTLALGSALVLADLGAPLRGLLNLPRYARPSSPFFGTFTMVVGGYLFPSLTYFFLAGRADAYLLSKKAPRFRFFYRLWASGFKGTHAEFKRHHATTFWLSLFILPLLVIAHSTLGFIFGIQGGRPGWFSALQAPAFVATAAVSGVGLLLVLAAVLRRVVGLENVIGVPAFRWLGNFLWILILVVLYFIAAEELTASYAAGGKEREFARGLLSSVYGPLFKLEIGAFLVALIILFTQFALKKTSIAWTVIAGLVVNVGAVLKRYLLVVPSLTHGLLLPYPEGHYSPTWVELGVIGSLTCLGILMISVFVKLFPIVPVFQHAEGEPPSESVSSRRGLRVAATLGTLLIGLVVAVIGFAASARAGTKPYLDPVIPFSPVVFIIGLIMVFSSGAVYELMPDAKARPPAPSANAEPPEQARMSA